VSIKAAPAWSGGENGALALAAALERSSRHPLAEGVVAEASARGLLQVASSSSEEAGSSSGTGAGGVPLWDDVAGVSVEPGAGVWGRVKGQVAAVGRRTWVESIVGTAGSSSSEASSSSSLQQQQQPEPSWAAGLGGSSNSLVWVGIQGQGVVGVIALRDVLRPDAKDTVGRLQGAGYR
jgi:cation transport ATPase